MVPEASPSWLTWFFTPIISLVLRQSKEVHKRPVFSPCYNQNREVAFPRTQLLSDRDRPGSQPSCFPAPLSFQLKKQKYLKAYSNSDMTHTCDRRSHQSTLYMQGSQPLCLMALTTQTPFPFASTESLPPCSQLCLLSTGHPRGEQACWRCTGGGTTQIPSPPVQAGPRQGTSISTRSTLGPAVGTWHGPGELTGWCSQASVVVLHRL